MTASALHLQRQGGCGASPRKDGSPNWPSCGACHWGQELPERSQVWQRRLPTLATQAGVQHRRIPQEQSPSQSSQQATPPLGRRSQRHGGRLLHHGVRSGRALQDFDENSVA
mmetsp:Transcript_17985/g.49629  ORF Transcript_17985/g.49629 Transcript_17985/m.49629 type:complete len:112 (+) Transcript_17985:189-524(+)